jgi:hypothetical protein
MHFLRSFLFTLAGCSIALLPASGQVTINEVMAENRSFANWDGSVSDWIELYNSGTSPVSLSNWSLSDSEATPRKWVFPNVTLSAGGYLLIALDSSRPASSSAGGLLNAGFGIRGTGDDINLYNAQGARVDFVRFGPQATDFTIGSIPNGNRQFTLTTPTPGAPNIAQSLGPQSALRINEWMASPATGDDWFEVFNSSTLPVALSGLYFVDSALNPSPVMPLSFIGVGRDAFLRFFADNSTNDNQVNFALGANGDLIGLYQNNGTRIDQVEFGPQAADRSQGRLPDGSNNIQSLNLATPNGSNLVLYEGLYVNEVLSHTDPPFEDAVEFYNDTNSEIDLSGWFLSNSRSDLSKYRLPNGTRIPAKGYLVIYEGQFNSGSATRPFTFNSAHGDRVVLSQINASGALTGYIVEQEFEAAERSISFGRHLTSVPGSAVFVPLQSPTFGVSQPTSVTHFRTGTGAPNSAPRVGPIVISEIMYNPSTNTAAADLPSDPDEYVKLINITGSPVALYDPEFPDNVWKITRGISYSFPRFSSIPANGTALLVSFDPQVNTTQAAAFRAKYSVPTSVPLFGPYTGKLDNSGEAISLYRPDTPQGPTHPDAGFVPYLLVDRVDYSDRIPWPASADGLGDSLQRKTLNAFGNDPANWIAGPPAAGQVPVATELKIDSIRLAGTTVNITFQAEPGRSYSLQTRSDINPGTIWRTQATTNATSATVTFQDTASATGARFYRVVRN